MIFLLTLLIGIAQAQLPYQSKEPSTHENEEFLYQELKSRAIDGVGCIDNPTLCIDRTNHRVGISSAVPVYGLAVATDALVTGNVRLDGTSATLTTQTTIWFNNPQTVIYNSSPTVVNQCWPTDPNGNYAADITTTPTAIHTNYVTYNFPQLAGTGAKTAKIIGEAYTLFDAGGTFGETRLNVRKGGTSGTGYNWIDCIAPSLASGQCDDSQLITVPVSSAGGIDYSCRPTSPLETTHQCKLTLVEACK